MTTHDYTAAARGWGHDFAVMSVEDGGRRLHVSGWGRGIKVGDVLDLDNPAAKASSYYLVESIRYMSDPPDQWFADCVFAPQLRRHLAEAK